MKWQLNVFKGNKILKPKTNGPHVKWEHAWLSHNLPWNWKLCNEGDKLWLPPFTFCYVRQAYHTLILSDKEISMKQCQFAMKKWTKSISMNFSFMDLLTWVFSWYHENHSMLFIWVNFKGGELQSGRHPSSYHQSFSCYVRSIIGSQKGDCRGHVVCGTKSLQQGLILNGLFLQ